MQEEFQGMDHQRKCSYCSGPTYPTRAEFSAHFQRCPMRIRLGYIPMPQDQAREKVAALRAQALKALQEADELEKLIPTLPL